MIVFDVEIKKGILMSGQLPIPGIAYCTGWKDFSNMGIACVCTYDTDTHRSRVFTGPDFGELTDYLRSGETGGFNTRRFDMPLLAANGVHFSECGRHYDALEQVWLKLGLDPDKFVPSTHGGWGLDAIVQETFGLAKSGHGAMAPVWWQQGQYGRVIDYCLNDVFLEAKLIMHMLAGGWVKATGKDAIHFERTRPTVAELEAILAQVP